MFQEEPGFSEGNLFSEPSEATRRRRNRACDKSEGLHGCPPVTCLFELLYFCDQANGRQDRPIKQQSVARRGNALNWWVSLWVPTIRQGSRTQGPKHASGIHYEASNKSRKCLLGRTYWSGHSSANTSLMYLLPNTFKAIFHWVIGGSKKHSTLGWARERSIRETLDNRGTIAMTAVSVPVGDECPGDATLCLMLEPWSVSRLF